MEWAEANRVTILHFICSSFLFPLVILVQVFFSMVKDFCVLIVKHVYILLIFKELEKIK